MVIKDRPVSQVESGKPFPGSRKVYVTGSRPDIRVPFREIALSPSQTRAGEEPNAPVRVYDTSGPYTDPQAKIDIRAGLNPIRAKWIDERNDTERLAGPTSHFGQDRLHDPKLVALRFNLQRQPRRAKAGMNVTQMHYAKKGMITPEMEFIALRENMLRADYIESLKSAGGKIGRAHV